MTNSDFDMLTSDMPTVAAVPGLLGFLSDDQRAVLFTLAGMDQGAPRTLEESVALLQQDAAALWYQQALINRALIQGLITPDPTALRLRAMLITDSGLAESVQRPGIYSVQNLVPAIRAARFPTLHTLTVVALWTGGQPEHRYPTGLRVLAPDHTELLRHEFPPLAPLGQGAYFNQQCQITMEFPLPGLYTFQVWLIGAPIYTDYLPAYLIRDEEAGDAS